MFSFALKEEEDKAPADDVSVEEVVDPVPEEVEEETEDEVRTVENFHVGK